MGAQERAWDVQQALQPVQSQLRQIVAYKAYSLGIYRIHMRQEQIA
jgi:hypothetical protein